MTWSAFEQRGVLLITLASAIVGGAAGCAPVGSSVVDHLLTGATAAAVTYSSARASSFALALVGAVVIATGDAPALHIAGVAVVICALLLLREARPLPIARALLGAVVVQSVLRLPWTSPARGTAVVAAVVMAIVVVSSFRASSRRDRRAILLVGSVLALVVVLASLTALYSVVRGHELLHDGESYARAGVDAARRGDRAAAGSAFAEATRRFEQAHNELSSWLTWPARQVPGVAPQLRSLERVAALGASTAPIARAGVTNVDPDKLRLVDGRLDLAVLASYRPTFDGLVRQTTQVRADLAAISRVWLLPPLDHSLRDFQGTLARADESARTADEAATVAPELLGASGRRTYLIVFVTPAEARGSGGLPANYAVLTAADGRLHLDRVGRGPSLDTEGDPPDTRHLSGPPDYLARYGKFDPAGTWENITMSPDWPSVAQVMAELYPQSGGVPVDGVIEVDPFAMEKLVELTGPVDLPGLPVLDSKNILQFLFHDQYTLITDPSRRSNLLGDIARAVFDHLTTGTSASPTDMGQVLEPALRADNLAFWFREHAAEAFVHRIGGSGAMPPIEGNDAFGVIVQNAGGNKIDNYLQRKITYAATVATKTGALAAHAEVVLHNASPTTGVPLYVIGNSRDLPPGTNSMYVSIYSPFVVDHATIEGKDVDLLHERELGYNVYTAGLDIPAGGTRTLTVDLRGVVDLRSRVYSFDYLSQTLPNPDEVDWSVNFDGARIGDVSVDVPDPGADKPLDTPGAARRLATFAPDATRGPWSVSLELHR